MSNELSKLKLFIKLKTFYEDIKYNEKQLRRLSMKPGITGLWQVSGRNSVQDFNDWIKLDFKYIDNWSFTLDAKIALKTIQTVLSGNGH